MRILLIRPCCIGDVVLATAALTALRRAYPQAHITWAVGGWSQQAIAHHPALDALLDTGPAALPVRSFVGFWRFLRQMRAGHYDLAVSLVRSPLMSVAVGLSGIPQRAGIDSSGRGFGYNLRAKIDPAEVRHEAEIYLDVLRLLGIDTVGIKANLPVLAASRDAVKNLLKQHQVPAPYIVIHPAGGSNPGMMMHSKRWPPQNFAAVGDALAAELKARIMLIGGPNDRPIVAAVIKQMRTPATVFAGELSFPQIGALAADAALYIGNDTGLTHLAAASGAKTIMIFGPSDPRRYAPFTANSRALWKPVALKSGGVAASQPAAWDWSHDGIDAADALQQIRMFLRDSMA